MVPSRMPFLGACLLFAACSNLTSPAGENPDRLSPVSDSSASTRTPPVAALPSALRPTLEAQPTRMTVRRIVIAHDGTEGIKPKAPRTLAEARKLASDIAQQVKAPDADFSKLAQMHSDAPDAQRGGLLAPIRADSDIDPALRTAIQQAKVGDISNVIETREGLQIIQRLR